MSFCSYISSTLRSVYELYPSQVCPTSSEGCRGLSVILTRTQGELTSDKLKEVYGNILNAFYSMQRESFVRRSGVYEVPAESASKPKGLLRRISTTFGLQKSSTPFPSGVPQAHHSSSDVTTSRSYSPNRKHLKSSTEPDSSHRSSFLTLSPISSPIDGPGSTLPFQPIPKNKPPPLALYSSNLNTDPHTRTSNSRNNTLGVPNSSSRQTFNSAGASQYPSPLSPTFAVPQLSPSLKFQLTPSSSATSPPTTPGARLSGSNHSHRISKRFNTGPTAPPNYPPPPPPHLSRSSDEFPQRHNLGHPHPYSINTKSSVNLKSTDNNPTSRLALGSRYTRSSTGLAERRRNLSPSPYQSQSQTPTRSGTSPTPKLSIEGSFLSLDDSGSENGGHHSPLRLTPIRIAGLEKERKENGKNTTSASGKEVAGAGAGAVERKILVIAPRPRFGPRPMASSDHETSSGSNTDSNPSPNPMVGTDADAEEGIRVRAFEPDLIYDQNQKMAVARAGAEVEAEVEVEVAPFEDVYSLSGFTQSTTDYELEGEDDDNDNDNDGKKALRRDSEAVVFTPAVEVKGGSFGPTDVRVADSDLSSVIREGGGSANRRHVSAE